MTEGTQEPAPTAGTPEAAAAQAANAPSASDAPPPPVLMKAPPARSGNVRRFFNWFWRGRELGQLRQEQNAESPRARQLGLRARLLFELGERTRRPSEPLPYPGDAAAAELYRQSAYFGVRAIALLQAPEGEASSDAWSRLRAAVREKLSNSPERSEELSQLIEGGSFVETWELSDEQRALLCSDLARVSKALLDELAWHTRARDALWIQRLLRITLFFVVIAGSWSTMNWFTLRGEVSRDLALGKPWRISSSLSGVGCTSPLQACGESTDYFFHTNEENGPWIELDLGAPTRFSALRIDNRKDCCFDRAVPLVIEVGDDQKDFKEVARRTASFSSWLASFPATQARYVRIRVPRQSLLHLARVRVLR